jgi:hypothetical protein
LPRVPLRRERTLKGMARRIGCLGRCDAFKSNLAVPAAAGLVKEQQIPRSKSQRQAMIRLETGNIMRREELWFLKSVC